MLATKVKSGQTTWMLAPALLVILSSSAVLFAQPKAATTAPATVGSLQDGWEEIDQRLVFLTVQLSTVESSLDAVNKAIRVGGYEQSTKQTAAEQARKGNELMDRNGGGPVPWSEFYGKTAQSFFYHPRGEIVVEVDPHPQSARPPQFDYIYRANARNQQQAQDDVAKLGNKIEALRARRSELESEQSALWCKIALRAVSSRDLAEHPLYQFDLAIIASPNNDERLAGVKAGAEFMRRINRAIDQAQSDLDSDQKGALDQLQQEVSSSRGTLNDQLNHHPALVRALSDSRSPLSQFSKCAKRLQDSAQNMVDAYRLANEGDQAGDVDRKNSFRGQLQQMVMDFASAVVTADQLLSTVASDWKVTPDLAKPLTTNSDTASSDGAVPAGPDIAARLDRAKSDYGSAIAESRKALLSAVDARLNAATDAGELHAVQSLQAVKTSLERGGTVSSDAQDPSILTAQAHYAQSIQSANAHLAAAYHDAVRDYTRSRKIGDAQATQSEFDATGLGATDGAAASASDQAGKVFDLVSGLPPFLEAGPPYGVEKEGIRPDSKRYLRTKEADFIDHDFIFDVWFIAETKENVSAWAGFGEGLRNGSEWRPTSSVGLHLDALNHMDGVVQLHKETENGEELGKLPDTGTFMVRIQKSGAAVTFAVGTEHDGAFRPDMSKRIDDIHGFAPFLGDHNSHLFFGSNALFTKVRLVVSGAPAVATASAMPMVVKIPPVTGAAPPMPANPAASNSNSQLHDALNPPDQMPTSAAPATVNANALLEPGLTAECFNDIRFEHLVANRVDPSVDFVWKGAAKPSDGITTAKYSVRWKGVIVIPASGILGLGVSADDGARLNIDGKDLFEFHNPLQKLVPGPFAPGRHTIQLEYWNRMAGGHAKLVWVPAGQIEPQVVPASALFHEPPAAK